MVSRTRWVELWEDMSVGRDAARADCFVQKLGIELRETVRRMSG